MTNDTIIPLGEYIHLSIFREENNSALIIQSLNNDVPNKGIVKAIGDKVNTDENSRKINAGDKVIFISGSGVKLTNSEDSDILISVRNIIGIIQEG